MRSLPLCVRNWSAKSRILALDIGDVRTGLAISDATQREASPLAVLATRDLCGDNTPLKRLIEDYEVERIVVGLPLDTDGRVGAQARHVQALAVKLLTGVEALLCLNAGDSTGKRIVFFDERHSSVEALRRGHDAGLDVRTMRGSVDSRAAAVFLQDYLKTTFDE